jgi:MFS family permease
MRRGRDKGRVREWRPGYRDVLRNPAVEVVLFSHVLSKAGSQILGYGSMVHLARIGGSQIEISLLSASGSLAALAFGVRGGAVADSLPKRVALGLSYSAQAALCFVVPRYLGTGVGALLLLIFAVSILTQITSPALKVAVAVVATAAELANVAVLLGFAGGIGTAIGAAVLAPVLIKQWGITIAMYAAGALFLFASIRAVRIPEDPKRAARAEAERPRIGGFREAGAWMLAHQAVSSMILVGAAVTVLSRIFDSLQPIYVRSVLGADPANAIYIFAPGAIGALIGQLASPILIRWPGERWLAVIALAVFSGAMVLFGLITVVADTLARFSPLRVLSLLDIHLSDQILAAGMIAILVEFAQAGAATSVQTYVNRRVPLDVQGTTFGVQSFLTNGMGFAGTLLVGALATVFGTRAIFLLVPPMLAAALIWVIRTAYRRRDEPVPTRREALAALWSEPPDPDASDASAGPVR